MSWATDRRLDYIAWRLADHGAIRRDDLMRVFGVSMPQASADLGAFDRAHPGAMVYDKSAKQYAAGGRHKARKLLAGIDWAKIDKV